jgi:hypothetical protein
MYRVAVCLSVSTALCACVIQRETTIHEPENRGFENHEVAVIGLDPAHGDPTDVWFDGHCVWLADGECLLVDTRGTWCELESVPMDVVLAFTEITALLCYREREPIFYIGQGLGDLLVPHTGVGATVYFVDSTDGEPLIGDIFVRGDEIMMWGNGQNATIIAGSVVVSGDAVQLRGLTIEGDLTVTSSATDLAFVTVRGNLTTQGTGGVFARTTVYGNLEVTGPDNVFIENGVQGTMAFAESDNICDGNFRFTDRDTNGAVSADEILGTYVCP